MAERKTVKKERAADSREAETTLEVPLAHSRWRHAFWAAVALGLGVLLFVRTGPYGQVFGSVIILLGIHSAWLFLRTLLHPAGVIAIREDEVELPPRVCAAKRVTVPKGELRHAYLLRRAVPWFTTGPLLVVETGRGVFQYPRAWFQSEADQRRIVASLNPRG